LRLIDLLYRNHWQETEKSRQKYGNYPTCHVSASPNKGVVPLMTRLAPRNSAISRQKLASFCREIQKLLIVGALVDFPPPQPNDRHARCCMTRWKSSVTTRGWVAFY
jgi:hypothetical protein